MIRRSRTAPLQHTMPGSRHRAFVAVVIVLAVVASGCSGGVLLTGALTPFDACDEFLDHVKEHALEVVTPYGIRIDGPELVEDEEGSDTATPTLIVGEDLSGTNVQQVGVDEPDRVKTDGRTMYVVRRGVLEVVDVAGDQPRSLATVGLGDAWRAQLMLHGDRLLVSATSSAVIPFAGETSPSGLVTHENDMPEDWGTGTTLTAIDVSDPSVPVVVERLTLDGWAVSSRMIDGVVRVVVRTNAGVNVPWEEPRDVSEQAEQPALDANRELIERSQAEDWLPTFVHQTADGETSEGTLLACDRVARPGSFAGLGVLSVLTIDLAAGSLVPDLEATGVLAAGETVYASTQRLYVATTRWADWQWLSERERAQRLQEQTTELHAFDVSDPRAVGYLGSGVVRGRLLDQWAMSEHDGHLRVASTLGDPWAGADTPSESLVTVLEVGEDGLVEVGQVTGLGPTETIQAVRFMGGVGYVVTFRQTDPLYTLDLRDPTDPQVTGELKIPGYSAYLHPVGEGLLLGVGQDADEQGETAGIRLSLFDVSDLTTPTLLDQVDLPDSYSEVEYDHRAFLHWPATGLTAVPFRRWFDWTDQEPTYLGPVSGVLTFTAAREDGITETAMLSHLEPYLRDLGLEQELELQEGEDPYDLDNRLWEYGYETRIRRSTVIHDRLVTASDVGLAVHDLNTLQERGWLTFGEPRR